MSLSNVFTGGALGAVAMYFFDPDLGRRRRALCRDQFVGGLHKAGDAADATARDMRNRLYGTFAELRSSVTGEGAEADDGLLHDRVRATLGRYSSHPRAIEVAVHEGVVKLRGPVLAAEVECLVHAVESVRGVSAVDNLLDVHQSRDISALQGGRRPWGEPPEWRQSNWSPTMRLSAGALGSALIGAGMTKGAVPGALLGMVGGGLILRALTTPNSPPSDSFGSRQESSQPRQAPRESRQASPGRQQADRKREMPREQTAKNPPQVQPRQESSPQQSAAR